MKKLFLLLVITGLISNIFALGGGTTSADFLKISVGARPSGMGEAFTGISDDANATFYNPAGIALIEKWNISFMHLIWYQETSYEFVSIIAPIDNFTNVGLSVNYLGIPSFNSTVDIYNNKLDKDASASYDLAVTVSFARNFGNLYTKDFTIGNISLGANLTYVKKQLIGIQLPSFFLLDLGLISNITDALSVGLAIKGISSGTGEDNTPFLIKLGSGYNFNLSNEFSFLLCGDVLKPVDTKNPDYKNWFMNLGAEFKFFDMLYLRGGYKFGNKDESFTAGAGIGIADVFSIDYAFAPHINLGDAHRISANFKFGEKIERPKIGAPRPPEKVVAVAGDRVVSIGWEPNPEANIIGYNIYYKEKKADKFIKLNKEPIMEEVKYKAVLNNDIEYEFVVTAINNRGLESIYSEKVTAKPTKYAIQKPAKVTGVMARIEGGNIIIYWNESQDKNVVGYNLYYKKSIDTKYKRLNKTLLKESKATLGGLTPGVEYNFIVTAVGKDGTESDYSESVTAKITGEEEYF